MPHALSLSLSLSLPLSPLRLFLLCQFFSFCGFKNTLLLAFFLHEPRRQGLGSSSQRTWLRNSRRLCNMELRKRWFAKTGISVAPTWRLRLDLCGLAGADACATDSGRGLANMRWSFCRGLKQV